MAQYSPWKFTLSFTDMFTLDMLDDYVDNGFFGMGDATRLAPRVLSLRPYRDIKCLEVKSALDELQEDGALTYSEERL